VPFREIHADIEGNFLQAASGLAHEELGFIPVRSGHLNVGVPPVPESGSDLIEAFAMELAVVLETAGDVPALATDIFEPLFGSVATVELDADAPVFGQERAQRFYNTARQAVLAAKGNASPTLTLTIEPPDSFGTQV